jgi:hypothetical protein
MWKCAASVAAYIKGMNELACVSCQVFVAVKVFRNSVKFYVYECALFFGLAFIK